MYYVGIDLGISACKLLLVNGEGAALNEVTKEYPLSFPRPGWSEQSPEDWWKAVRAGIPELLCGRDASQVAGIGAGGQMHGLVALDEDDNVIRPAILWNDGRTAKEVDYFNETIGRDKLSQYTANIAFAGFTAPQAAVDARERAGLVCENPQDYAPQGLHQLHADGRSLHGLFGRLRDATAGRSE